MGVSLSSDARWLQVYSADNIGRVGVAVEPMSCPPNAFNSGTDVVALSAGQTHTPQRIHPRRWRETRRWPRASLRDKDDAHGCFKTRFRPFDKGVVDVDLLAQSCEDEGGDEREQRTLALVVPTRFIIRRRARRNPK